MLYFSSDEFYLLKGRCALERWKGVVGYEGLYQVSDHGRVRSVDRVVRHYLGGPKKLVGKVLRPSPTGVSGYLATGLCKEGKGGTAYLHQIVMAAWVGPCPDGLEICHGPKGVEDNSLSNLSYDTHIQNCLDKRRDGTDGGRCVVRSDGVKFNSMRESAEKSDCRRQNISGVCRGKAKTAGGYGWRYCDD